VSLTYAVVVMGATIKGVITMDNAQRVAWSYDLDIAGT
jgi:hypothetical protein